jgi:CubicO group peptidase (beta-lactamase class C family)
MKNNTLSIRIEELVERRSDEKAFSGVMLVKREEEVLFDGAWGFANRAWQVPIQIFSRFRIASISKMFTAVAILQLIEQGKLTLESRIVDLLDLDKSQIPLEVTVYHLLTMTSGIADWFDESGDWEAEWQALIRQVPIYLLKDNEDYLPLFVNQEPLSAVGEQYHYNGAGYILLGLIVEEVGDKPYFDFIREHIFNPVGMADTEFLTLDEIAPEVAEGYMPVKDSDGNITDWKRNIYSTTPFPAADGGATATADDLVLFSQALRAGNLLSLALTKEMLTPKVIQSEEKHRGYTWKYGFANMFLLDDAGKTVRWGHTGEEDGVSGRLYYYPQQELDVIILSNHSWGAADLAWEIHDLII